jgi:hypothetical protein
LSHDCHLIKANLSYGNKGNSVILSHGGHLIQSNLSYVTKGTV